MIVLLRVARGLPGAGGPALFRESEHGPVRDALGRTWPLQHGLGAEIVQWVLEGPRPLPPGCLTPAGEAALTRRQREHLEVAGCLVVDPIISHGVVVVDRPRRTRATSTTAPPVRAVQGRLFG